MAVTKPHRTCIINKTAIRIRNKSFNNMSNIKVNTTELVHILDMTPSSHNVMLVGDHGIGKSEILTDYYSSKGMTVTVLFLGQMADTGDLTGLPRKNEMTGKTEFMPPYWFPVDGKPIVLFMDELNRARPEILQTIMDLALNRTLAGRPLPEGSRIIAAVNDGDRYQLTDLDPALVSRFNIMKFQPTTQEWLLWARKNEVDGRVISFIEENPMWLDKDPDAKGDEDTGLDKSPDRRAWKRVSDICKGSSSISGVQAKVISSIVGAKAASKFMASVSAHKIVTAKELLTHYQTCKSKIEGYSLHDLSVVNDSIFRYLEVEKITDKEKACSNLQGYFDWLAASRKEAAAHFATLYTSGTYKNAVAFIARECIKLTMNLIIYIRGIGK